VRFLERLNSPIALVVAVTVFLVLDGLLLYRYQQSLRSTEDSASNTPLEETTSPLAVESATAKEATSSPNEGDGVRVVVEVGSVAVGLSILEDGQLVYDEVAGPGFSEEFEAEEIVTVTAADAGAVQVEVNGDDLGPLGASGEAATRTFTAEAEG
jgi:hypothetical protein